MAEFEIGRPVKSRDATVIVDGGLPVGRHRFQLQVATADGRRSEPDIVVVVIERTILRPPGDQPGRPPVRPDDNPTIVTPVVTDPAIDGRPRIRRTPRRRR